jgi:hypothetical protein
MPDFGPLSGGSQVILKGNNFKPFDFVNDIDNTNDTFCMFGVLGKTKAQCVSHTECRCLSPKNTLNPPVNSV